MKKNFLAVVIILAGALVMVGTEAQAQANTSASVFLFGEEQMQKLYVKPWTLRWSQAYWGHIEHCREWVTLRSEPSTSATSLVRIPLGAKIMIYDCEIQNGFYRKVAKSPLL